MNYDKELNRKLSVMHAFGDGLKIEQRIRKGGDDWRPAPNPGWYWGHNDYRIAPGQQNTTKENRMNDNYRKSTLEAMKRWELKRDSLDRGYAQSMAALESDYQRSMAEHAKRREILKAAIDGKPIQFYDRGGILGGQWLDADGESYMQWDWTQFEYRVNPNPKPEVKYRPWTREEALGQKIRWKKDPSIEYQIVTAGPLDCAVIALMGNGVVDYTYASLLEHATLLNGEPCGVKL